MAGKPERLLLETAKGSAACRWSAALLCAFVTALFTIPPPVYASALSEGAEECLGCHEDDGMEKDLDGGEVLSLFIPPGTFGDSVHGSLDCTDCHGDVSVDEHPEGREIASLDEYRRQSSLACADCHDLEGLGGEMHSRLVSQDMAPACSECHRPHAVEPIAEWKASVDSAEYCLTCHRRGMQLEMGDGDMLSLAVGASPLDGSVHLSHECGDCHEGFEVDTHPVRDYKSRRDHSVILSAVCRQCHDEKYGQYEGSIHYTLLKGGNLAVPVCTDCHGFHSVKESETIARLSGMPCQRCHQEVFEAFGASKHGMAGKAGHLDAPACSDCHRAHEVRPAFWAEEMKDACASCHPDALKDHGEWLPNAALHLDVVACPACHTPRAERGIELVVGGSESRLPITAERLRAVTGGNSTTILEGDGFIDTGEIWSLLRSVDGGTGEGVALLGRMRIRSGIDAHRMEGKSEAVRECTSCHSPGADPFKSVSITLLREDGRPLRYEAENAVLGSASSIGSIGGFYVLGGTRIGLLDFLLIAAVLGGMSVPALHMTARTLARRAEGGGK